MSYHRFQPRTGGPALPTAIVPGPPGPGPALSPASTINNAFLPDKIDLVNAAIQRMLTQPMQTNPGGSFGQYLQLWNFTHMAAMVMGVRTAYFTNGEFATAWARLIDPAAVVDFVPSTNDAEVGFFFTVLQGTPVVVIAGTPTTNGLKLQFLASSVLTKDNDGLGSNLIWINNRDRIREFLQTKTLDPNVRVTYLCHSQGGAVGTLLGMQQVLSGAAKSVPIIFSVGMPKPGDATVAACASLIQSQIIQYGPDPIPSLPPDLPGYLRQGNGVLPSYARVWEQYRPLPVQVQKIAADYTSSQRVAWGLIALGNFAASLAVWAGGLPTALIEAHLASTYQTALLALDDATDFSRGVGPCFDTPAKIQAWNNLQAAIG